MRKITILFLLIIPVISAFSQKDITLYRTYIKENNSKEKISFEYYLNNKTGEYSHTIFFIEDYFDKIWYNQAKKTIAHVTNYDSCYYHYYNNDSAIVYRTQTGKNIKDQKIIFNNKGKVILEYNYLNESDDIVSFRRFTYINDTLLIGTADFKMYPEIDKNLTQKSDSTYNTYDDLGRITGEYSLKSPEFSLIDSLYITEHTYTDSTETMWSCEKVGNKYMIYKRELKLYDKDQQIISQLRYRYPDIYDGKTEYTYELSEEKKNKYTKALFNYRADGSLWKTRTFRREEINR